MTTSYNLDGVPVVTLRTLLDDRRLESPSAFESEDHSEGRRRFALALNKLRHETQAAGSADVLVAAQDRDTSMLQSRITELRRLGDPLPSGGLEAKFGEGIAGGDIWGWVSSVFNHVSETSWHEILRPASATPGKIADNARVAVLGDWGTNLYGAPVSTTSIARRGGYELLLHLGDVYYSGTASEMEERFLRVWPTSAGRLSRALNGNHEMYPEEQLISIMCCRASGRRRAILPCRTDIGCWSDSTRRIPITGLTPSRPGGCVPSWSKRLVGS
jgi:hypothetical protein